MKKQIIFRMLIGFPLGIMISNIITIIVSYSIGKGQYYPVVPSLIQQIGNETTAVVVQLVLSGIYGAIWAGSSVIWEIEDWSLLKMTVTHFLINSVATFPVAYYTHWMEHNLAGIAAYFGIFIAIYAGIWVGLFGVWNRRVKQINTKIQEIN